MTESREKIKLIIKLQVKATNQRKDLMIEEKDHSMINQSLMMEKDHKIKKDRGLMKVKELINLIDQDIMMEKDLQEDLTMIDNLLLINPDSMMVQGMTLISEVVVQEVDIELDLEEDSEAETETEEEEEEKWDLEADSEVVNSKVEIEEEEIEVEGSLTEGAEEEDFRDIILFLMKEMREDLIIYLEEEHIEETK